MMEDEFEIVGDPIRTRMLELWCQTHKEFQVVRAARLVQEQAQELADRRMASLRAHTQSVLSDLKRMESEQLVPLGTVARLELGFRVNDTMDIMAVIRIIIEAYLACKFQLRVSRTEQDVLDATITELRRQMEEMSKIPPPPPVQETPKEKEETPPPVTLSYLVNTPIDKLGMKELETWLESRTPAGWRMYMVFLIIFGVAIIIFPLFGYLHDTKMEMKMMKERQAYREREERLQFTFEWLRCQNPYIHCKGEFPPTKVLRNGNYTFKFAPFLGRHVVFQPCFGGFLECPTEMRLPVSISSLTPRLVLEDDCNLVIIGASGHPHMQTGTHATHCHLELQKDGHIALMSGDHMNDHNHILWHSSQNCWSFI